VDAPLVIAQAEGEGGGAFLVSPGLGLMIWTLVVFGITLLILRRYAFPRIVEALDRRRGAIEESIDHAERTRAEADALLQEYRERLREARQQSEDIVARARKAADRTEDEARARASRTGEEMIERARREIAAETRRSLADIRKEVANLTVLATEKVARKTLDTEDHRRLVDEALSEVDFDRLAGARRGDGGTSTSPNGGRTSNAPDGDATGTGPDR
jgi:F-type H+-transporting ATPase subunit b